jgi:LL-diaminopimelate aminotransferase
LAGGQVYEIPIGPETNFLVDFDCIPADIAAKAKILWLSYPNNPTGAVADLSFFEKAVKFAKANDILICHDNPYSEICFDGLNPPSILEVPGAKEVCIEFGSLSKPFNMTGWRIGWAVGNAEVISTLTTYKTNVDSGQFQAIQEAAITALKSDGEDILELISMYQERRDKLIDGMNSIGWKVEKPKATFYVWAPLPNGWTSSIDFAEFLLNKAGIVVTPGVEYGKSGEGYVRLSLTVNLERIDEALRRLKQVL